MKDIETREDIVLLVDTFYKKINEHAALGYIFNSVAKIEWAAHLPKMYSFWASILLGEQSYSGNPMLKHIALSAKTKLSANKFKEWLRLFKSTVYELFEGEKADMAVVRAENIARLMLFKIEAKHE